VVLAILGIALARGALRGLVRETFSVASVGAAVAAVILFSGDTSLWLLRVTEGRIGEMAAPYAAGALLAVLGIGATALTGRFLRRGATAVGLGWFDRTGGALLGTAEGLLLAGIVRLRDRARPPGPGRVPEPAHAPGVRGIHGIR
jgi:membrane protein required for colicin V production